MANAGRRLHRPAMSLRTRHLNPTWLVEVSSAPIAGRSLTNISLPLFAHCRPGGLDFRFHGIEVEARAPLHRRELDRSHGQLLHLLLDKNEAPEFVLEPREVILRPGFGPIVGPARALEWIEAKVGQIGHVSLGLVAQPAAGLVDETILEVVDAHGAKLAFAEVPDLMAVRWSLAGDHVHLVITVPMDLVGAVTDLLTLLQLLDDVRIAGSGQERREP